MKNVLTRSCVAKLAAGSALALGLTAGFARTQTASADMFKADLQVTPVSSVTIGVAKIYYVKVKNNGVADATNAQLTGFCWNTWGPWQQGAGFTGKGHVANLGTVKAGETRTVPVFCAPPAPGYQVAGLRITGTASNELDISDNAARFGHTFD